MAESKLILLAHGSKDPLWRVSFEQLLAMIKQELGDKVELAYLQYCSPNLEELVEKAYQEGNLDLTVLPLFMSSGSHLRAELPKLIQELETKRENLKIRLESAIGEDLSVQKAILELAKRHV